MQNYTDKEIFDENFQFLIENPAIKKREQTYDDWLEDYEEEIEKCKTPIVDLGCGLGNNTDYLIQKGKEVLACDYSKVAIETIQREMPKAKTSLFDMTQKFPIEDNFTDVVIADLCLHYFDKKITEDIIREIKRILKPNGILLFRVNSINDVNYLSDACTMAEDFVWTPKSKKSRRLFNEQSIREFFADWKIEKIKEEKLFRYDPEKILWNCAVRKV